MASFVRRDYQILSATYRMRRHYYRGALWGFPDQVSILLGVARSDFNVSWFGYHQAYRAIRYSRVLGRRSLVILGGFDVCEEEDPYLSSRIEEIRYILLNAGKVLALSKRVQDKALAISPTAHVDLAYPGFDANRYRPSGEKQPVVSTVAVIKRANLRRKGLETFVRSAAFVPECSFFVVGEWLDDAIDYLRSIAPKNVFFPGRVSEVELIRIFQQSSVYVQASTHEGFGCSLAEGMLCGCVPVVSDRGAIPEVVGDTGIYVNHEDSRDVARGVQEALGRTDLGRAAHRRIVSLFPIEKRREALIGAVEGILGAG